MEKHKKSTVFVIDDDPSIRRALTRLFTCEGFEVESFPSAVDFLECPPAECPGCLVLDLQLPEIDGLELQGRLKEVGCHLPIVFVSAHGRIPDSVQAMKGGAIDFLTKPFDNDALLNAVRQALDEDRQRRFARFEHHDLARRQAELTPREQEVFTHIVVGMLNKDVADALGISEKTVKVHRARVMEKMQADSLAELVRIAEKLGM